MDMTPGAPCPCGCRCAVPVNRSPATCPCPCGDCTVCGTRPGASKPISIETVRKSTPRALGESMTAPAPTFTFEQMTQLLEAVRTNQAPQPVPATPVPAVPAPSLQEMDSTQLAGQVGRWYRGALAESSPLSRRGFGA
jgi:hypothetical protein